jgi:hypothetical protein
MDDIQRKLALFDQQLAGRNLHKQIKSTLVFVAVGERKRVSIFVRPVAPSAFAATSSENV